MRVIKDFSSFSLNEDTQQSVHRMVNKYEFQSLALKGGNITLYRLTSHPVVDLSEPGEYYVSDRSAIDPKLLEKPGSEMFLITVNCDASNIDAMKSKQECDSLNNTNIVAVKDDTQCEVVSAVPYKD